MSASKSQSSTATTNTTTTEAKTAKCAYPGCLHEDKNVNLSEVGTTTIKDTKLAFHPDCFTQWTNENRGSAISQEAAIKALEPQGKK